MARTSETRLTVATGRTEKASRNGGLFSLQNKRPPSRREGMAFLYTRIDNTVRQFT